ncbi:hypothetical protein PGQ11_010450 [Apiospora arundinis]|uniref:Uncharacterized protein n=1 Tax=Apiospora arundinis TaxID=335852 RepID=A0ABR2I9W2_9PEZI
MGQPKSAASFNSFKVWLLHPDYGRDLSQVHLLPTKLLRKVLVDQYVILIQILLHDARQRLVALAVALLHDLEVPAPVALLAHREGALHGGAHGAADADPEAVGEVDELVGAVDVGAHDGVLVLVLDLVDLDALRQRLQALGHIVRVPGRLGLRVVGHEMGVALEEEGVVAQLLDRRGFVQAAAGRDGGRDLGHLERSFENFEPVSLSLVG